MTAAELFAEHKGGHCTPPGPVTAFFRRVIAAMWRKPAAVPAVCAGAAPAGDAVPGPHIPADRFFTESLAWAELDAGRPVLNDQMLSQVREQWNSWHDDDQPSFTPARPVFTPSDAMTTGEFAVLDARVDAVLRPVNGRSLGTQPRRHPELNREFTDRPGRDVLERVIAGLRKLPVYGERPQVEVDKLYRNGWQ